VSDGISDGGAPSGDALGDEHRGKEREAGKAESVACPERVTARSLVVHAVTVAVRESPAADLDRHGAWTGN
jgi:hypothetical protein